MREKERIDRIISKIEQVMLKENKSFTEVIKNCLNRKIDDPFYLEDSTIERSIDSSYDYVDDSGDIESKVMNEVANSWKQKQDLRLFQIICNNLNQSINKDDKVEYDKDPFELSDPEVFKILKD